MRIKFTQRSEMSCRWRDPLVVRTAVAHWLGYVQSFQQSCSVYSYAEIRRD